MAEKKTKPMVWRKMNTMEYYPGQYSCSDADVLQFSAHFSYDVVYGKEPEVQPYIRISYSVGGDRISELHCKTPEEAFKWLLRNLEKTIAENKEALASGMTRQIEDT